MAAAGVCDSTSQDASPPQPIIAPPLSSSPKPAPRLWQRGLAGLKVAEALEQLAYLQQREDQLVEQLRLMLQRALSAAASSPSPSSSSSSSAAAASSSSSSLAAAVTASSSSSSVANGDADIEEELAISCQKVGAELEALDRIKLQAIAVLRQAPACDNCDLVLSTSSFLTVVQQPPEVAVANRYLLPPPTVTVVLPPRCSLTNDRTFVVRAHLSYVNSDRPLTQTLDGKQDVLQGVLVAHIDKHRRGVFQKLKIMEVSSKHQHRLFCLVFRLIECHQGRQIVHPAEVRSLPFQVQSRPHKRKRETDSPIYASPFQLSAAGSGRIESDPPFQVSRTNNYPDAFAAIIDPGFADKHLFAGHLQPPYPLSRTPITSGSSSDDAATADDDDYDVNSSGSNDSSDTSDSDSSDDGGDSDDDVSDNINKKGDDSGDSSSSSSSNDREQASRARPSAAAAPASWNPADVSIVDVSNLFGCSLSDAARKLGVHAGTLAERYRQVAKRKWPSRKIAKIDRLLAAEYAKSPGGRSASFVARLNKKRQKLTNPSILSLLSSDFIRARPSAHDDTDSDDESNVALNLVEMRATKSPLECDSGEHAALSPSWLPSFALTGPHGHTIQLPSLGTDQSEPRSQLYPSQS